MSEPIEKFGAFKDFVEFQDDLRDLIGPEFQPSLDKEIDHVDDIAAAYIAASTFVVVASSKSGQSFDLSPKGDPAGFVKVLDPKHIAIPDRPGNRRVDTLQNLIRDPRIALLFLVPGMGETLRVYGEAKLVRDRDLLAQMSVNGRMPQLATVVYVERLMIHCPKCIVRSGLWSETPPSPDLPGIGAVSAVHAGLSGSPEEQEAVAKNAGVLKLY